MFAGIVGEGPTPLSVKSSGEGRRTVTGDKPSLGAPRGLARSLARASPEAAAAALALARLAVAAPLSLELLRRGSTFPDVDPAFPDADPAFPGAD